MPGGTEVVAIVNGRVKLWEAKADGPPFLLMVWPVKTWVVEVPAESVSVTVAV